MQPLPARRSLPISLLALLVLAPPAGAIDGLLGGHGTAVTFTVYGEGLALRGGAADWSFACAGCLIRISFSDTTFVLVQNGHQELLPPGAYELREFRGFVSETMNAPYNYEMVIVGAGEISRLG